MSGLAFSKYHGLGNDFVIVDGLTSTAPEWVRSPEAVRWLCDRRRGVGADGVLLLLPSTREGSDARMLVLNADGTRPQMCGNGIRCVARFLFEQPSGVLRGRRSLLIDTDAGPRRCEIQREDDGQIGVRVDMGAARLERNTLPMVGDGRFVDEELSLADRTVYGTAVSMGNPHFVIFTEQTKLESLARELGPLIEHHAAFPERTNVEVARLLEDGRVEVWVWERGVGITHACGTGACATAAAAVVTGRCGAAKPIQIVLPGGTLQVTLEDDGDRVWMAGSATPVYRGQVDRPPSQSPPAAQ